MRRSINMEQMSINGLAQLLHISDDDVMKRAAQLNISVINNALTTCFTSQETKLILDSFKNRCVSEVDIDAVLDALEKDPRYIAEQAEREAKINAEEAERIARYKAINAERDAFYAELKAAENVVNGQGSINKKFPTHQTPIMSDGIEKFNFPDEEYEALKINAKLQSYKDLIDEDDELKFDDLKVVDYLRKYHPDKYEEVSRGGKLIFDTFLIEHADLFTEMPPPPMDRDELLNWWAHSNYHIHTMETLYRSLCDEVESYRMALKDKYQSRRYIDDDDDLEDFFLNA